MRTHHFVVLQELVVKDHLAQRGFADGRVAWRMKKGGKCSRPCMSKLSCDGSSLLVRRREDDSPTMTTLDRRVSLSLMPEGRVEADILPFSSCALEPISGRSEN